jgi:hypothetical protein
LAADTELAGLEPAAADPDGLTTKARAELLQAELAASYAEGIQRLGQENWAAAEAIFRALLDRQPSYRDVQALLALAERKGRPEEKREPPPEPAATKPAPGRIFSSLPGRIGICYRRQETGWPARQLYDVLVQHFPREQVGADVDIEPGDDFVERIAAAVASCAVLLVLIGPQWLTITNNKGQRRLDDPEDFVRIEIETALTRRIRVIPVLVDDAKMPGANELPATLAPLVRRNAVEINPLTFDTKRLISTVSKTLEQELARRQPELGSNYAQASAAADAGDWEQAVAKYSMVAEAEPGFRDVNDRLAEARRQHQLATLQAEVQRLHRAGQWAAVIKVGEQLQAIDLTAADPGGLVTSARTELAADLAAREPKIFLCYRRDDTRGFAHSLYRDLAGKYGRKHVFRDIDSTPVGVKFTRWIELKVSQCNVMVVLIGDAWSSGLDRTGQRRLDLPKDWVRQEIEAALKRDIPIIPVRMEGARMPSEDELPPSIADLASFQSAEVTDSRWDYDVGRLIEAIDNHLTSSD